MPRVPTPFPGTIQDQQRQRQQQQLVTRTSTPERTFTSLQSFTPSPVNAGSSAFMPPPPPPTPARSPSSSSSATAGSSGSTIGELIGTITTFLPPRQQVCSSGNNSSPQVQGLTLNVNHPGTYAVTMDFNPCPCIQTRADEIQRNALEQSMRLFQQFDSRTNLNNGAYRRSWP